MSITITVNNVWSKISGLQDVQLSDALDAILSYHIEGYQYTKAFKSGYYDRKTNSFKRWDGLKHLFNNRSVFPTGLLTKVTKFFESRNILYTIDDRRPFIAQGEELEIQEYTPRPYQKEAVDLAVFHGRGIIKSATGSGKTLIAAMIVAKYNLPSFIYVIGKDLLFQFHKEMEKALGMPVGLVGDGKCILKKVNVCSVWTAITSLGVSKTQVSLDDTDWDPEIAEIGTDEKRALKAAIERTNLAIFDEAHFLATDTLQSIYKAGKNCRYLYGLTASPWRDDGADLLIESVCGPKIYNMPASKLISMGYLTPPHIVLYEVPPMAEAMSGNYASVYSKYVVKNEVRNGLIVDVAKKLIEKGRKLLILVRYLSHGRLLASMLEKEGIPLFFVNGEVDGETRQEVKTALENGDLKCLLASSVFDVGIDIPKLDSLILAGSGKSSVKALQRIGRVIRIAPGKKDAIIVDFIDSSARYLDKHFGYRLTIYESEPAFKIKFPKGFDPASIKRVKKVNEKIS